MHALLVTDDRRRRWEARAEWPLTALAVVFLAAYAVPILESGVSAPVRWVCVRISWGVWGVFVGDYLVRWLLSERRWSFVRGNVLDLLVIVLPLLRPLRMLRLLTLLDVLNRRAASSFSTTTCDPASWYVPPRIRRLRRAHRPRWSRSA